MVRKEWATLLAVLLLASRAPAQQAGGLRWQTGQVLTYRVEQDTQALEVVGEEKVKTQTSLRLTKRWQVTGVEAGGVATVQLTLLALRYEMTPSGGEPLKFDSATPEQGTPQLREQMGRYVGPVLAVLRVDAQGKVLEVKDSKFGPASRFEAELPFAGILPVAKPVAGQTWERVYKITVEPPQGTGEKYDAVQRYTCKKVEGAAATVAVTTELKAPPQAPADQVTLQQSLPEGEIVFDTRAGRLYSAALHVNRQVKGHQGEGSSYQIQSKYNEQLVGDR